jgi:UDP-N-acetylmuramate dehydrogenase
VESLKAKLQELDIGTVLEKEPLSKHTTIKIGGPADLFVEPKNIQAVEQAIALFREYNVKWRVIGKGSNLLVPDEGVEGIVLKLGKGLDHLVENGEEIRVGGGYPLIKLATIISRKGLSGLEFAGGIPGSVGGSVYMNAGAHGSDISKILKKTHILFADGTMKWLSNEEMAFSYRTSVLQRNPGVCLETVFQLKTGNREQIVSEMQKNKDYRRDSQPWNYPCCGSVFRNPLPNYAGQLIENAGLKGTTIGGAQISEMHGNFIINVGNAKAQDVLELIKLVKDTIKRKHNIEMETEVELIGQ